MRRRKSGWATHALLAVALCLVTARGASASVIFSDNFDGENGGVGALNYAGFANFAVTLGTVDLIGNGFFDFLPGNGLYVDLDGSTSDAGVMTKSAPMALGAGSYVLSFDLAGNRRSYPTDSISINVFGIGGPYGSLLLPAIPSASPFTNYTIPFVLGSADAGVQFSFSNAGGDNVGALLDDVQLSSVPEPTTLALLGSAVVGLVVRRRRPRA